MIKFFRKIRQNLVIENKTSKYFKYAIGEIVLVVIGILIALQINNANENRKQRIVESSYLKRLIIDLEENKIIWKKALQRKKKQLKAAYIFINFHFSENQDTISKIIPYFQSVGSWQDINVNQVTFNEMVNSGNLNIISNDSIKIKLLDLDKHYKAILNNQAILKEEHKVRLLNPTMQIINTANAFLLDPKQKDNISRKITAKEITVYANQFQEDLKKIIKDKVFINGVVGITYNAQSQFSSFKLASKKVDELIVLLKKEIELD